MEPVAPQLYAILNDADPQALARLLDAVPVACVRLDIPAAGEADVSRAADALRPICHDRDIPLLLTGHYRLVRPTGVDGVHLNGSRDVRDARTELGKDGLIGAYVGASRHAGMSAGEAGADYISFGPVSDTGLGSGELAPKELFALWSEAIELPVVADGGVTTDVAQDLCDVVDFFALEVDMAQIDASVAAFEALHKIAQGASGG